MSSTETLSMLQCFAPTSYRRIILIYTYLAWISFPSLARRAGILGRGLFLAGASGWYSWSGTIPRWRVGLVFLVGDYPSLARRARICASGSYLRVGLVFLVGKMQSGVELRETPWPGLVKLRPRLMAANSVGSRSSELNVQVGFGQRLGSHRHSVQRMGGQLDPCEPHYPSFGVPGLSTVLVCFANLTRDERAVPS